MHAAPKPPANATPIVVPVVRRREDYLQAFRAVLAARLFHYALVLLLALLVLDAVRGWLGPANARADIAVLIAVDIGVTVVAWGIAYLVTIVLTAQKMYHAHIRIQGAVYTFESAGLQYASSNGNSFTAWDAFASYRETSGLILLFHPNRRFQLIPKRSIDPARLADLRELLSTHIGK
ncbi:MAG: YcxB family protein [Candidatus Eremiobacteraeota bacterium]|nr:YcxB family protein [Candidatus Eremiobacteraeota bacterium]